MSKKFWWHRHSEENLHRFWVHYREFTTSLEICILRKVSPGVSLHIGDRGSETPIDWYISFYFIAFFGSFNWPGLGEFCEWLGRGHKRNLSLRFFGGAMWWQLWYDDDGGHDSYHKCDKRRKPLLPPWRWGREKYRSWMCIRDGNIELNPFSALWGHRFYHYEDIAAIHTVLYVNQFAGDQYKVTFTLQKETRARRHGPKLFRGYSDEGYVVEWQCDSGIPFRNHSWKGDCVYASGLKAHRIHFWVEEAKTDLADYIIRERLNNNYRPPTNIERGEN